MKFDRETRRFLVFCAAGAIGLVVWYYLVPARIATKTESLRVEHDTSARRVEKQYSERGGIALIQAKGLLEEESRTLKEAEAELVQLELHLKGLPEPADSARLRLHFKRKLHETRQLLSQGHVEYGSRQAPLGFDAVVCENAEVKVLLRRLASLEVFSRHAEAAGIVRVASITHKPEETVGRSGLDEHLVLAPFSVELVAGDEAILRLLYLTCTGEPSLSLRHMSLTARDAETLDATLVLVGVFVEANVGSSLRPGARGAG